MLIRFKELARREDENIFCGPNLLRVSYGTGRNLHTYNGHHEIEDHEDWHPLADKLVPGWHVAEVIIVP